MSVRCKCGEIVDDKVYIFFDEDEAFGCRHCITKKKYSTWGTCPHCRGIIDPCMSVFIKDDRIIGCSECVARIDGKSSIWDRYEDEEYI